MLGAKFAAGSMDDRRVRLVQQGKAPYGRLERFCQFILSGTGSLAFGGFSAIRGQWIRMNHEAWRQWAKTLDDFRVVPRIMLVLYGWVCVETYQWFMALGDPTTAQVTFATAIWGAAAAWFGFYVNTGKK